jgi:hypothetical protein
MLYPNPVLVKPLNNHQHTKHCSALSAHLLVIGISTVSTLPPCTANTSLCVQLYDLVLVTPLNNHLYAEHCSALSAHLLIMGISTVSTLPPGPPCTANTSLCVLCYDPVLVTPLNNHQLKEHCPALIAGCPAATASPGLVIPAGGRSLVSKSTHLLVMGISTVSTLPPGPPCTANTSLCVLFYNPVLVTPSNNHQHTEHCPALSIHLLMMQ